MSDARMAKLTVFIAAMAAASLPGCKKSPCAGVQCQQGQVCEDGVCIDELCVGIHCEGADEVCVDGLCMDWKCVGVQCPAGQVCLSGYCGPPACEGVDCPARSRCELQAGNPVCACEPGFAKHWNGPCAMEVSQGACTYDGWCWQNPLLSGFTMTAAWGIPSGDLWFASVLGVVMHRDGNAWWMNHVPQPHYLWSVWASGPDDVWVAGAGGSLYRWDGLTWQGFGLSEETDLVTVFGFAPDDVWVGGIGNDAGGYRAVALHWDGNQLSEVPVDGYRAIARFWGSSAGDLWALAKKGGQFIPTWEDGNAVLHRDGGAWTELLHIPREQTGLRYIWGGSPSDIWILGGALDDDWSSPEQCILYRWDGTRLSEVVTHFEAGQLTALRGRSADEVWLLGAIGWEEDLLARWDGTRWRQLPIGFEGEPPNSGDLWVTQSGDLWLPGFENRMLHRDATTGVWSDLSYSAALYAQLRAVWAAAPDDVWAVGDYELDGWTIFHFDGQTWIEAASGAYGSLVGIWGAAPDDIWAVGFEGSVNGVGIVLHWDGSGWTPVEHDSTWQFAGVWGAGPDDVWISGYFPNSQCRDGGFLHWNGTEWTTVERQLQTCPQDLHGFAADSIWCVAWDTSDYHIQTVFLHWDGADWTTLPHPQPANGGRVGAGRLWATGPNEVWFAGSSCVSEDNCQVLVLGWDGVDWTYLPIDTPEPISALWGTGPDDLWASGWEGSVFRYDGTQWSRTTVATDEGLSDIFGLGSGDVWVVGWAEAILHHQYTP